MSLLKVAGTAASSGTLYVDDVFSTWLYTGNNSTQTITNGIDLAGNGGLVWVKSRSAATDNKLTDTVRGATKAIISNSPALETTDTTGLTAFSSTGFSLGASAVYNANTVPYASWTFRKAAKFFDVVTYTGDGTSNRAISHNLGIPPGMVVCKCYGPSASFNDVFDTYHRGVPNPYIQMLALNSALAAANNGADSFGDGTTITQPTTSNFYVGVNLNASGKTYVAYLFAHDTSSTGIIQCGSFTTDGAGNFNVNLGWEPQYVMIKHSNTVSSNVQDNWIIYDTMRGFVTQSGNGERLYPNLSNAAANGNDMGPTATGFESKGNMLASQTFIYMAIRRPNKPPTSGTQVYNAIARTGTGAVATVTGVGFTPDWVDIKKRSGAETPRLVDRLRGNGISLFTTDASAESNEGTISLDTMDGCTLGASFRINESGSTYINWFFKRAPGFFDEVCYTGTGTATTQAHNLTVVPELMIVKERSAANDWWVYVSSIGNTKYSVLNSTAIPVTSSTAWNNTTPTASVFSIGTATNVNASTQTFVAYLFATLAGISKVGSYTGNGTGQAIACGFSAGARFVLIKRTDAAGAWYTFDSARGLTSGSSPYLLLNSTAAEVTGNNGVYASTGGFTLDSTASTTTNINGASYIYLSVA